MDSLWSRSLHQIYHNISRSWCVTVWFSHVYIHFFYPYPMFISMFVHIQVYPCLYPCLYTKHMGVCLMVLVKQQEVMYFQCLWIMVADYGHGMTAQHSPALWEPTSPIIPIASSIDSNDSIAKFPMSFEILQMAKQKTMSLFWHFPWLASHSFPWISPPNVPAVPLGLVNMGWAIYASTDSGQAVRGLELKGRWAIEKMMGIISYYICKCSLCIYVLYDIYIYMYKYISFFLLNGYVSIYIYIHQIRWFIDGSENASTMDHSDSTDIDRHTSKIIYLKMIIWSFSQICI